MASFALSMTVAFLAPLQGFNNFLVYIRPKLKGRQHKGRNFCATLVASIIPKRSQTTGAEAEEDEEPFRVVDPSVLIASVRTPRLSQLHALEESLGEKNMLKKNGTLGSNASEKLITTLRDAQVAMTNGKTMNLIAAEIKNRRMQTAWQRMSC